MGKHLSYAERLELIRSILFGIVQFWLSIFPMPDIVINQITCICWNFLWTSNTARSKSTLVAWKHIYLLKNERCLRLYDMKARNNCFIAK
jgi:hypothetical protein